MRVRQITGTKLAAQVAAKTRFGWYKTGLLATLVWAIVQPTLSQERPDIAWMRAIPIATRVTFSPDGSLIALGGVVPFVYGAHRTVPCCALLWGTQVMSPVLRFPLMGVCSRRGVGIEPFVCGAFRTVRCCVLL